MCYESERDIVQNGARYVTRLPFRLDHNKLTDNFEISKKRLKSLQKRLSGDKMLLNKCNNIFTAYEKSRIMEKVPDDEIAKEPSKVYYLSYRPVVRRDKETTKVRVVFDASYSTNKPSLNDCLFRNRTYFRKSLIF